VRQRSVAYTDEAADDLDGIYDAIAAASGNLETASRYEQRIRDFCGRLGHASERGGRRDDVRSGLRIIGFERRVTIAFAVEPERVVILRIFYGGWNWEDAF
jgi:toxin ParE1/3/4